jgi:hypothetical protein
LLKYVFAHVSFACNLRPKLIHQIDSSDDGVPCWEPVGSVSQPVELYQVLPDLLLKQGSIKKNYISAENFSDKCPSFKLGQT